LEAAVLLPVHQSCGLRSWRQLSFYPSTRAAG
jgi:hypothetical protein